MVQKMTIGQIHTRVCGVGGARGPESSHQQTLSVERRASLNDLNGADLVAAARAAQEAVKLFPEDTPCAKEHLRRTIDAW